MTTCDNLRRLHFINALFAGLTGHDLYLAQQIQSASSGMSRLSALATACVER